MSDLRELEKLRLPATDPAGLARHFGPGMILMMTGIGTSHLVTAPKAGADFQYALLWCVLFSYVFKYYGFEMAFRFTNATGRSMLDAYGTAPRKWPVWYVLVTTLLQCAIGQAGRLAAASAVVYYVSLQLLGLDVPPWLLALALGVVSVAVILKGRYGALELVTKLCAGLLFVASIAVYFAEPAPLAALGHFFMFDTPEGSSLILASFLGLLPTGIDVSLQASEWGRAKRVGTGRIRDVLEAEGLAPRFDAFASKKEDLGVDVSRLSPHVREYCQRWFRIGLWDFRIGHAVSFVVACIFLLLAAVWLFPKVQSGEVAVRGNDVMGVIATIFTESVGPWMMTIFIAGAFAATFSTAFNYFDGWPRVVGACCRNLFRSTARLQGIAEDAIGDEHRRSPRSEYNVYRLTMLYSLVASVIVIAVFGKSPVWLVLIASALAYFVAPVIFFLNFYYCITVIPKGDRSFYPSRFARWFTWLSLVVFTGMVAVLIQARIVDRIFGG